MENQALTTVKILWLIFNAIAKGFFCGAVAWHLMTTTDAGFIASSLIWVGAVTVFFSQTVNFGEATQK